MPLDLQLNTCFQNRPYCDKKLISVAWELSLNSHVGIDLYTLNLSQGRRGCVLFVKQNLSASKITFDCEFNEYVLCQINPNNTDNLQKV